LEPNKPLTEKDKYIGGIYLLIRFVKIFLYQKLYQYLTFMGNKSFLELKNLIFDKILKLSPSIDINTGEIYNFVQIDSNKLNKLIINLPNIFSIPIILIAYNYLLYQCIGISFVPGVVVMIIFLLINYYYRTQFSKYLKLHMKKSDARIKATTEVINNLKVIKLNAWDDLAIEKIQVARGQELNALDMRYYITTISQTLLWFAPIAMSIASIGLYQYLNDEFKIADVFTSLGIFTSFKGLLRNLPNTLDVFVETLISLSRIEKFLDLQEVDDTNIEKYEDISMKNKIALQITNGNFTWNKNYKPKSIISEKLNINIHEEEKDMNNKINSADVRKPKLRRKTMMELKVPDFNNKKKNEFFSSDDESSEESGSESDENTIEENIKKVDEDDAISLNESQKGIKNPKLYALKNINFTIKEGEFVCIIGEVGSGKSSLIQALLNNMIQINKDESRVIINGSISYVPQEAWIQNDTLRNNILFYLPYDANKYYHILEICELKPDLESLIGGDMTEIGEKGINLSGGQRARINIARALYNNKDIYIFDDPLSALDANVGKNIVRNCIKEYLEDKTRILITHALQHVYYADKIYYMKKGKIIWEGDYKSLLNQEFFKNFQQKVNRNVKRRKTILNMNDLKIRRTKSFEFKDSTVVKRLYKDEKKEVGIIKSKVFFMFFSYMGGFLTFVLLILVLCIWQSLKIYSDIWLGYWSEHQKEKSNLYFFSIYAFISITSTIFNFLRTKIITKGSLNCSMNLHFKMITSLIKAPINLFHDKVPKGQIFNRLSKDLTTVDTYTMYWFMTLTAFGSSFFGAIAVCGLFQYQSLFILPLFLIFSWLLSRFYMNCSRELNRLEGISNSPILNMINEAISGKITIRAFNYQMLYIKNFQKRIDENYKINFYINSIYQWYIFCLNFLEFIFLSCLICISLIYKEKFDTKTIGLLLTYSIVIQEDLIEFLSSFSNFENTMTNMERSLSYTKIISERPQILKCDRGLLNWPSKGEIIFENLCAKYRSDTELVLKNVSLSIKAGEHIGLVGRTGCGKSTLALCLARIIEPQSGKIYIDDVDITSIGLKKLRENLTIITQETTILDGTLRYNFDPRGEHNDKEIYKVLKKIGFDDFVKKKKFKLNHQISENGSNLSIGEKQLICITRAILKKSKIVILDEATASIDFKHEEIVQKAIDQLLKNSTLISIAHRIKTVLNSDKILVLENGEVKEFDKPDVLLKQKNSYFSELYTKSLI
jgi:ABC-type multidrug transport system fused ATPase/permease subunit